MDQAVRSKNQLHMSLVFRNDQQPNRVYQKEAYNFIIKKASFNKNVFNSIVNILKKKTYPNKLSNRAFGVILFTLPWNFTNFGPPHLLFSYIINGLFKIAIIKFYKYSLLV